MQEPIFLAGLKLIKKNVLTLSYFQDRTQDEIMEEAAVQSRSMWEVQLGGMGADHDRLAGPCKQRMNE